MRCPLDLDEKLLILAERIRKKDVPRYTYKPTTQYVSLSIFGLDLYLIFRFRFRLKFRSDDEKNESNYLLFLKVKVLYNDYEMLFKNRR